MYEDTATSEGLALTWAQLWAQGAPLDDQTTLLSRMERLDPAAVGGALRRALHPDGQVAVVVGDPVSVLSQLEGLGWGPVIQVSGTDPFP